MPKSDVALLERVAELEAHVQRLSHSHAQIQAQVESLTRVQAQAQAQTQAQADARARARAQFQVEVQAAARAREQAAAHAEPVRHPEPQPENAALAWAEAQFVRTFEAAPAAASASAMSAVVGVAAFAPQRRVSHPKTATPPRPVAVVSHRITDTLSDLRVSLGAGHALSAAVERLLSFVGIWRASEWDDRDDLRDSSSFAPIVPWYRRSGLLLFFIVVAIAVFFAVGGLGWTRSRLTHDPPRAVIPPAATSAVTAPGPAVEAPRINMLAGTPFEKSASSRAERR